ncbi:MAG: flagellar M-ring protein FliF [Candidatus Marinimicrobia bacterium]|nr:flagellar M-ring protein FliF [Candidatus Neomarinimicrobiota bacterium]
MKDLFIKIGLLLQNYTLAQRFIFIFMGATMMSSLIALLFWANSTDYVTLYSDLSPSEANRIVEGLSKDGIEYEISSSGTTVLVPDDQVNSLRLKFNRVEYGDEIVGFNVFDKSNFGMTTFMQKVNLQRALEGELTKTINQMEEVRQSRVHLVIPEKRLFDDSQSGSASIVLYLEPNSYLSNKQTRGLAVLVSNSIDGVDMEDVSIVDAEGNVLFEEKIEENEKLAGSSEWDVKENVENKMQQKVQIMLDQLLGSGNSSVQVAVNINFDKTERTSEIFDSENPSIISEERNFEAGMRIDSTSYNNENSITNYELNKTVEHYISGSAKITRITVAALVNGKYENVDNEGEIIKKYLPRNNEEKNEIAALIKQTIGFDLNRGDEVKVANLEFDHTEVDKAQMFFTEMERKESINKWISRGLMTLALIAMMFFVVNLTHSLPGPPTVELEEAEATLGLEAPEDMLALTGATSDSDDYSELDDDSSMPDIPRPEDHISTLSLESEALLKAKDIMTDDISNFVDGHPDNAAKLIRTWLAQDLTINSNEG